MQTAAATVSGVVGHPGRRHRLSVTSSPGASRRVRWGSGRTNPKLRERLVAESGRSGASAVDSVGAFHPDVAGSSANRRCPPCPCRTPNAPLPIARRVAVSSRVHGFSGLPRHRRRIQAGAFRKSWACSCWRKSQSAQLPAARHGRRGREGESGASMICQNEIQHQRDDSPVLVGLGDRSRLHQLWPQQSARGSVCGKESQCG